MNELICICKNTAAEGLPISCVWVEPISRNRYRVLLVIDKWAQAAEVAQPLVDQKEVPAGVRCTELSRWPEQTSEIVANEEQVEAMVADLATYSRAADWARFEGGNFCTKPSIWLPPQNMRRMKAERDGTWKSEPKTKTEAE